MSEQSQPLERRASDIATERLASAYDKWMADPLQAEFFRNSDYYNYGYTTAGIITQQQACENLVEKLLTFIPDKSGSILDVACGFGATTRHLLRYYAAANVTGINISDRQLERARQNAPGCRFLNMDAVDLDFADASFDNVICVEAAFHFNTRERFLREAFRVLKPGGNLVLSDILGWQSRDKRANYLRDPAAYAKLLEAVGFQNRVVVDATKEATRSCGQRLRRWPGQEWRAGRLPFKDYLRAWPAANLYSLFMRYSQRYYLLAKGQKPTGDAGAR